MARLAASATWVTPRPGLEEFARLARPSEPVEDPDPEDGDRALARQELGHGPAQTTDDAVLFGGDDGPGPDGHGLKRFGIQGLHGRGVDDPGQDTLGG